MDTTRNARLGANIKYFHARGMNMSKNKTLSAAKNAKNDAFGKLVASSGLMAEVFSFRYSTKYFDPGTGFYYYGYRYYSPELMRWITRDPIGEEGGGRPMKGAVLAHERGHAKAFFEFQKPLFESKISSLISKPRLSDAEKRLVESAYKSARVQTILDSARLANEAEKDWYVGNGFSFSNGGGVYVFEYK